MSKQTELVGLARTTKLDEVNDAYDAGALSNRNLIINGGFTVWQRSLAGVAANGFNIDAADRWYSVRGALSQEIENSVPYCHMVHGNFADSCYINHRVEDFVHTLGKQVTISYKIKSDDGLGADGGIFIRYYNISNTYTTPLTSRTYVYGSDWTTITYTFTMPTTTPKGAGYGLEIFLYGDLNSVNNNGKSFDVKEVQLELGKVATPFEHISYGDQLQKCMRYFCKNGASTHLYYAYQYTASFKFVHVQFPVQMRAAPSASFTMSSGSWTTYLHDEVHWKAYGSSGYADAGTYQLNSYSFDAEL